MLTKSVSVLLAIFFALSSMTANAVLERVGPVDPANGFPKWYMDITGVALELCLQNRDSGRRGLRIEGRRAGPSDREEVLDLQPLAAQRAGRDAGFAHIPVDRE